jgi:hypothetical protein
VRRAPACARRSLSFSLALAAAAGTTAIALDGCGGVKAADLFLVTRTGATPQAQLTLLVNEEGLASCNGKAAVKVSDPQLVQAHAIQEELHDAATANLSLPPQPGSVLTYTVREESGTVRFSDNSAGQPRVLRNLALFVLQVAQGVCHLPE